MATTANIKNGAVILHKNKRMKVLEFLHVKPGKGPAFVRTKLKDIQSGKVIDETFNSGAKLQFIRIEAKAMQYLYENGNQYIFMDNQTYDQINVNYGVVGSYKGFLKPGLNVDLLFDGQEVLKVRLPAHVNLEVSHTDPGMKGNTATGSTKPATMETGIEVNVPLFINVGDVLRLDTRTGNYIERAKN